jgi:hypothetical protein
MHSIWRARMAGGGRLGLLLDLQQRQPRRIGRRIQQDLQPAFVANRKRTGGEREARLSRYRSGCRPEHGRVCVLRWQLGLRSDRWYQPGQPALGYWYYSDTQEATGSPCYDYFYARLRSSTGATITTPQQSCNSSVTNGWVFKSFDLTSALSTYAGKQVQVYFQGTTDVSLISDFFVDDVTLNVS